MLRYSQMIQLASHPAFAEENLVLSPFTSRYQGFVVEIERWSMIISLTRTYLIYFHVDSSYFRKFEPTERNLSLLLYLPHLFLHTHRHTLSLSTF